MYRTLSCVLFLIFSWHASAPDHKQKDLMLQYYDAVNSFDAAGIESLFAEGAVINMMQEGKLVSMTPAQWGQMVLSFKGNKFSDTETERLYTHDHGVQSSMAGAYALDFNGMKQTGIKVITTMDGKITHMQWHANP